MRNIVTTTLAALALSVSLAGAASASALTDGGNARATKVLTDASRGNLVIGNEGSDNGEQSPLGLIVTNNVITQAAATSELPSPSGE